MAEGEAAPAARAQLRRAATILLLVALTAMIGIRLVSSLRSSDGKFWDFTNYYNAGSRIYHGESHTLYDVGAPIAGRPAFGSSHFTHAGFPISAAAFAPLGAYAPARALTRFKAACAASFAVGIAILYFGVLRRGDAWWSTPAGLAVLAGAVLLFEPAWFVMRVGGQSTPMAFVGVALFVWAHREDRPVIAALGLSSAILFKPALAPSAWILLVARDWRSLGWLAAAFALWATASVAIFGVELHFAWARLVLSEASRWQTQWWNNAAPVSFFAHFWENPAAIAEAPPMPAPLAAIQLAYRVGITVGATLLAHALARRVVDARRRRERLASLAIAFALLAPSVVWPHYLSFLVAALAPSLARWSTLARGERIVVALALLSCARASFPVIGWTGVPAELDGALQTLWLGLFMTSPLWLAIVWQCVVARDQLRAAPAAAA